MKRALGWFTVVGLLVGGFAVAQAAGTVKDGKVTRSARDEIARLEKELADQRALLIRILQLQVEHDQQMLRLAQGQAMSPVSFVEPTPAPAVPVAAVVAPKPVDTRPADPINPRAGKPATAAVVGKVKVTGASGPAWVFIEDVKAAPANGTMEIRQEGKQFLPRTTVVPRGTKVNFPNFDSIFHNVFSVSEGNTFDLGTARAGDPVKSYVMMNPGVVEIFCNMHSRMSASVLVAPSSLFAKVESDGSFRIDGVPVGSHKISAWAGGESVASRSVDVSIGAPEIELTLNAAAAGAHKNKLGQPYGSYAD